MVPKPEKTFQRLQRANVLISVYWEQGCCAESACGEGGEATFDSKPADRSGLEGTWDLVWARTLTPQGI